MEANLVRSNFRVVVLRCIYKTTQGISAALTFFQAASLHEDIEVSQFSRMLEVALGQVLHRRKSSQHSKMLAGRVVNKHYTAVIPSVILTTLILFEILFTILPSWAE